MNRNLVRLMTGPAKLVTIVIIMSSVLLEDVLAVHFQVAFVQSVYLMMTVKVTVIHSRELFQRHFVTRQMVVTEFVLSGNGHPIDDNGYPVWLGTEDDPPLMIQRNVHNEGPPTSLVWRFELNNQPGGAETANAFAANATHISIPMKTNLLAGYSMSNQMVEEHESGIVSINFVTNPWSIVTPYPSGACTSEKYHTLSHEGPLDESRKQAVQADLQGRSASTQQYAEEGAYRRATYMVGSIKRRGLPGALIEAGQDVRGLQELRAYVQQVLDGEIEMSADTR